MTVVAGVDVGNATTEVVLVSGGTVLGAGRVPTRGRKGSADSLRGAAALVRRVERRAGCRADEARIAPLRAGMLAVDGPGGLLPFDRRRGPGEWRAIRLRLKLAVLARNFQRAVRTLGPDPGQVLVVGGPAGDEELLGVLARSLPDGAAVGRGDVGGGLETCAGESLGPRYAVALGLALASGC